MATRSSSRTAVRGTRSPRRAGLAIGAIVCFLLGASYAGRAQSALQPPPQTHSQPATGNSAPVQAGVSSAPDNPLHTASRDELDIVKVLIGQEHAWNAGDIEGFMKGFKESPDTLFIGREVEKGYRQIFEDYRRDYATRTSMGTLTYAELEVTPLGDTYAICTGRYHVDRGRKDGGPAEGLFSIVFEKTDQGWKIVLDHTT